MGLSISAVVHVLGLLLYPFFSGSLADGRGFRFTPPPAVADGTQVIEIIEIAETEVIDPDAPVELVDPEEPAVAPEVPDISDTRNRFPDRYRSAAERMRAGQGDPRLWTELPAELVDPTPEEVARLRLLTAIEAMNDSSAAAAERAARAMDWTYTDDDGERWGVSPGKIHLGGLTIPLPFGFGPPPDYDGDRAQRAFDFNDIDRAAGSRAAQQTWKERAEIMRQRREERKAQEEDEKRPPVVRPDTTSVRR